MKTIFPSTLIIGILFAISSFTKPDETGLTGTYGVSENDPAQIELILNKDHTFTYQDLSNPDKNINVSGNWSFKNNQIILKDDRSELSFNDKWKIINDGTIAKSRKGMTFYTLRKR